LHLKRLSYFVGLSLLVLFGFVNVWADPLSPAVAKLFPPKLDEFRLISNPKPLARVIEGFVSPTDASLASPEFHDLLSGEAEYQDSQGRRFLVQLIQFRKDADAYSLLTLHAQAMRDARLPGEIVFDGKLGTASVSLRDSIALYKGNMFALIRSFSADWVNVDSTGLSNLAQLVADKLDKGEGDIPVLIKHFPDSPNAQKQAVYLADVRSLKTIANDPVLAAIEPIDDAEAALAHYGAARMLMVEFNTPQLSVDNDRAIVLKIQELRNQNQPVPTSYRRVGNYSVFVFDASSEQAANQLIDQVKYEQVVQWLGDNPYWLKEAEKRYAETTLGVLVAVVKASGLTLLTCFGLGGLIGAILFNRRRARQATAEAFSDAGGMLRLNLDEMTQQTDPARLLSERN
jgi:hypothetical protein